MPPSTGDPENGPLKPFHLLWQDCSAIRELVSSAAGAQNLLALSVQAPMPLRTILPITAQTDFFWPRSLSGPAL